MSFTAVSRRLSKDFGLQSRKPARNPRLTHAITKETGLCQTTSPLKSRAEEESVDLRLINHATVYTLQEAC